MSVGATHNTLSAGTVLVERYQLEKVIGLGGMSTVYMARDCRFQSVVRHCAIKEMFDLLPDQAIRDQSRQAFEREANILASLSHAAIPKVFDFFSEGDRYYLVLELVEGQDLGQILRQRARPLAADQVLLWSQQICAVMAYLHSLPSPIIFRDLKPSNVMLRKDGQIMMVDFGIAKHFAPVHRGTMIGTEGYAPPEQYEGMATPHVDIYALGATLHHLLTNTDPQEFRPFSFDSRPIRQYNPAVSPSFETIIMKALAYNPEDRWNSAAELLDALRNLGGRGTSTFNRMRQAATGGLQRQAPTNWELPKQGTGPVGGDLGEATRPVGEATGPVGDATGPVGPATGPVGAATGPVSGPATTPVGMPPSTPAPNQNVPYTPPVSVPRTAAGQGTGNPTPIWVFQCEDEVRSSPYIDEDLLYIGCYDNNLYCLDNKTGEFKWKFATDGGIPGTPAGSETTVIVGSEDQQVYSINKRTGRLEWSFATGGRVRSSPRLAFDHVFVGSDDGHVYAINAMRGWQQWKTQLGYHVRSSPVITEKLAVVGCEDGHVVGMDLMSGEVKWKVRTNGPVVSSPATFGSDRVIVGSMDWLIYGVDPISGFIIWRFRMSDGLVSSPFIYDERAFIGCIDGSIACLEADWGKLVWRWRVDGGGQITSSPVVHDGLLFIGCTDGALYCLNAKMGKTLWRFQTGGPIPGSPRVENGIVYVGSTDQNVYAIPATRTGRL